MKSQNIDKMLHEAHVRHQRQMLKADHVSLPCAEVRGCRREMSRRERDVVWQTQWSTGLRPNFWKAYFETLEFMQR
jgi:hypothetical protein